MRSLSDLNITLPPVDDLSVPVGGLFVLMVLFTLIIGPVNLLVLTHWKRRLWTLWTVPTVSLLTCLSVFGYMVFSEGWQGHARVTGFTILDESDKRAISIGRTAFYSPLTPSDGLHFSSDTEVSVQGNGDPFGHYGYGGRREPSTLGACAIDWTDGQHLARGWVTARVPAHFQLRKVESRRERVMVTREGGSLVLVNALGTDIKRITLADEKGFLYTAENVLAGEKATLTAMQSKAKGTLGVWRSQLYAVNDWVTMMKTTSAKAEELLVPRSYLAVVDGSPFLEQALKRARSRQTESWVMGLMADLQ